MNILKQCIVALMISLLPSMALADYTGQCTFTVQAGQMSSSQTDFPFLLSVQDAALETTGNGGDVTDAEGDDIVASSSDCSSPTVLDYELVAWDGSDMVGTWTGFVESTGGAGHTIYLCYGDSGITSSQEDVAGTWNASFVHVWHMNESSGSAADSKGGVSGTYNGTSFPAPAAGPVFQWQHFNGSDNSIGFGDPASVDFGANDYAFSAWINTDTDNTLDMVISKDGSGTTRQFAFLINSDLAGQDAGNMIGVWFSGTAFQYGEYVNSDVISEGTDYHVVFQRTASDEAQLYVDGALQTTSESGSAGNMGATTATMYVGRRGFSGFEDWFDGFIGEMRVYNTDLSADWWEAEANLMDQSSFWGSVTCSDLGSGSSAAPVRIHQQQQQ